MNHCIYERKMCRFAGVPTPKSVSEFIRDSPGHWDTGTWRHKKKMCRFAGVPTPKSVSEFIRDSPGHWDTGTGRHKGEK